MKKKSKNFNRIVAVLLVCLLLMTLVIPALGAISSVQWWHMVDSGKHLDWAGSTKYQSDFNSSVSTWNAYKSGVIRKDSILYVKDATISDERWINGTAGETNGNDKTIKFNLNKMDTMNQNQRRNLYTHELGHALGLDHNQVGDVMYYISSSVYSLSANDKASYDTSYNRY
ncbi:MAG: matrixin family metalloprotease [Methanosarcinales archaeon]|jgi:hypothetical protein|nr:matrixin family metalloprotease [Methanosarcinales archaeon]